MSWQPMEIIVTSAPPTRRLGVSCPLYQEQNPSHTSLVGLSVLGVGILTQFPSSELNYVNSICTVSTTRIFMDISSLASPIAERART